MIEIPLVLIRKIDRVRGIFKCFCGKEVQRYISEVRSGRSISCGCLRVKKADEEAKKLIGQTVNGFLILSYEGRIRNGNLTYKVKCPHCSNVTTSAKCNFSIQFSCGCLNLMNVKLGDKYGQYVVLEILKDKKSLVICKTCGTKRKLKSSYLKKLKTNKCFCFSGFNEDNDKDTYEIRRVFNRTMNAVHSRGRLFELDFHHFKTLMSSDCFYCKTPPSLYKTGCKRNGIDRIDSKEGYIIGNVVSCCYKCNVMKSDLSKQDFKDHIEKIYNNIGNI